MGESKIHIGSQIEKIFSYGKWYLLASLATKGLGLFLLPVYTRYLSPEEYGKLNVLMSLVSVVGIFISLYLDTAYERFFFDRKTDGERSTLFSTLLGFVLVWGLLIVGVGLVASKVFITKNLNITFFPYIPIEMVISLASQVGSFGQSHYKCRLQAKTIASVLVVTALFNGGLSVALLVGFDLGVLARLIGMTVASLLTVGLYGYLFFKDGLLTWELSSNALRQALSYALPLLPRLLTQWIVGASDRVLLTLYGKTAEAGVYSVAHLVGSSLLLFENAIFNYVYGPVMLSMLVDNHELAKVRIARFFRFYLWIFIMIALSVSFFAKEIVIIMADSDFASAYVAVPIISFGYVLSALQKPFNQILRYHKATWLISVGTIGHSVVSLSLNVVLIPKVGKIASAWAVLGAFLFLFVWMFSWSQKYDRLALDTKNLVSIVILLLISGGFGLLVSNLEQSFVIMLFLKMLVVVSTLVLSFILPVFTKQQRQEAFFMILELRQNLVG